VCYIITRVLYNFPHDLAAPVDLGHRYVVSSNTLRHTTLCRTLLDEWYIRRKDPYLTTHNTHNRQASMPQ